ncbi:MAG UNVERIFIED_CONTAM: hypothetical protein LOD86_16830 [Thermobifida fusca]
MRQKIQSTVLAVVSGVEFVALTTGWVPTWTSLVRRLPWWGRCVVAACASVWLFIHFETWRRP